MEKPITVMKNEFDSALVELVNNSGLPAFIMKPTVQSLLQALENLEAKQLQADMERWEQEQEKEKGDEEET